MKRKYTIANLCHSDCYLHLCQAPSLLSDDDNDHDGEFVTVLYPKILIDLVLEGDIRRSFSNSLPFVIICNHVTGLIPHSQGSAPLNVINLSDSFQRNCNAQIIWSWSKTISIEEGVIIIIIKQSIIHKIIIMELILFLVAENKNSMLEAEIRSLQRRLVSMKKN